MGRSLGRGGRRRRVLNEEVLSASATHQAYRSDLAAGDGPSGGSRYGEAATEQPTTLLKLVPLRPRWLVLGALSGLVGLTGLAAAHLYRNALAAAVGLPDGDALTAFDIASPTSIATWVAALLTSGMACLCCLIYSLRRHRVDDYRGRYRAWLWAAAGCLILSLIGVTHLHTLVAQVLALATGWTALPGNAAWWLLLGGPPLAWIGWRVVRDLWECKLSRTAALAGCVAGVLALASHLFPVTSERVVLSLPGAGALIPAGLALAAQMLWCFALVSYARHVVLEIQGLAPAPSRPSTPRPQKQNTKQVRPPVEAPSSRTEAAIPMHAAVDKEHTATGDRGAPSPQHTAAVREAAAKASARKAQGAGEWVDGSRPERDWEDHEDGDESGDRKLSKADRKRLRKLKAQNRAA